MKEGWIHLRFFSGIESGSLNIFGSWTVGDGELESGEEVGPHGLLRVKSFPLMEILEVPIGEDYKRTPRASASILSGRAHWRAVPYSRCPSFAPLGRASGRRRQMDGVEEVSPAAVKRTAPTSVVDVNGFCGSGWTRSGAFMNSSWNFFMASVAAGVQDRDLGLLRRCCVRGDVMEL